MTDGLRRRLAFSGQQLRNFPEWTSTHGVSQVGRSRKWWCIGFWTIITLVALGLLIWQIVLIFIQYYQYDVALKFEQRTFPAVTLCDLNPYKKSIANEYTGIERLTNAYMYTMQKLACSSYPDCSVETNATLEADMEMYGLDQLNDTVALQTKVKRLLVLEAANYDMTSALATESDFMQGCSFNTADCNDADWSQFEDPVMGRCFTFNRDSTRNASRAGPIYGLRVILKTNISEYLLPSDTAGMRILVHDQQEFPFPDIFGYNVQVGTSTSIGVTFQEISRLGHPYGECTDDKPDIYLYPLQYSTEGCQRSIYQTDMTTLCGCYDPAYAQPNGTDVICQIPANYDCWNSQSNTTVTDANCTQPCHEGVYDVTVSSAKWPSPTLTAVADCIEGEFAQSCHEVFAQNGALVEVYYEKLNYETMDESPAYTVSTFLSDFGGQIGLFLGMSVISAIEILVLCFQICVGCCSPKLGEAAALK
ncbi:hypothetical protein M3Y99_01273000 [Aphelenchoides fujianensis]|nr:hypothetical protein M3Y99_01273000 [Aphelenchoides fujianensis]